MSKKGYRQLKNRLYRETKRRMILERDLRRPLKFDVEKKRTRKLLAAFRIPEEMADDIEYVKRRQEDAAAQLGIELLKMGCIEVETSIVFPERTLESRLRVEVLGP